MSLEDESEEEEESSAKDISDWTSWRRETLRARGLGGPEESWSSDSASEEEDDEEDEFGRRPLCRPWKRPIISLRWFTRPPSSLEARPGLRPVSESDEDDGSSTLRWEPMGALYDAEYADAAEAGGRGSRDKARELVE